MTNLKTSLTIGFKDDFSKSFNKLISEFGFLSKGQKSQINSTKQSTKTNKSNALSFKNLGSAISNVGVATATKELKNTKIDFSTVLGGDLNHKELENFFKQTQNIAKNGLASFQNVAKTKYNISTRLEKNITNSANNTGLKAHKATKSNANQVASLMATAGKNFGVNMGQVGNVLVKTQAKFEFVSLNQLRQGFANLEINIVKTKNSFLKLVATLKQADKAISDLSLNKKAKDFQLIFGNEGKRGLLPLLQQLPKIDSYLKELSKNSKSFAGQEAQKHYQIFEVKMQELANSTLMFKNAFAINMLPVLIKSIDLLLPLINHITIFMEQNTKLTQSVLALGIALEVLSFLAIPLKAFHFAVVGLIALVKLLKMALIGLKLVFLSTPIAWVVAGFVALVGIGVLLYKKFKPVRDLFNAIAKPFDSIVKGVKSVFGSGNKELKQVQEQNLNTSIATTPNQALAYAGTSPVATSSLGASSIVYNNTFNIQGASAEEVVNLVIKKLNKQNLGAM